MRVHVCSEDRQELLLACAMASRSERMRCAARRQQAGEGSGWALGGSGADAAVGPAGGSAVLLSTD